ncbi:MAG: hypothetical protein HY852_19525 [Bradyrhizobium sp.]|uniref:hypothetical protein n=1 Tax=Bradyrhizobium sp. TaxID=376 RepID=UPI0025BFC848|nr:hypothetical protein [Bradyrhizobium sp.]MBI5264000.1 hypothetical protein [Bradyrhizobium sp.]
MFYMLDDQFQPAPIGDDILEFIAFEKAHPDRIKLAEDRVRDVHVRTIFLGWDHAQPSYNEPLLFETMVFRGGSPEAHWRHSTFEEAMAWHAKIVEIVIGLKAESDALMMT